MTTYAPATISTAAAYLVGNGFGNSGIVGNAAHIAAAKSYHLGKSQLDPTAYSIATARDKAGLTEAASALDIGRGSRPLTDLQSFSVWLVAECRRNAPGTSDIREVIYSADGVTVLRWDRERGYASAPKPGEADDSHLWHTHVSWYRDSEYREKVTPFREFFEGGIVQTIKGEDWVAQATATGSANGVLRDKPSRASGVIVARLAAGSVVRSIGELANGDGSWRVTEYAGKPAWLLYKTATGTSPDWLPLVQGGDPATDAALSAYIDRKPTGCSPADLLAARRAEWDRVTAGTTTAATFPARP